MCPTSRRRILAIWNGLDDQCNQVASGVYLYTLKAEGYTETRKLLLIR